MEPMNIISQNEPIQEATTVITNEAVSSKLVLQKPKTADNIPVEFQGITDFMLKPYLSDSGSWIPGNAQGTDVVSRAIGPTLFSSIPWSNKLQGFNLFRGTAVIRLMINANPFQQGLLMLRYIPCYSSFTAAPTTGFVRSYNLDIASKTQHPGVYIDARDSMVELRIPYCAPTKWYAYSGTPVQYDWGTVFVTVVDPLSTGASATSNSVDYTMYIHFEDFEMAGPVYLESSQGSSKRFAAKKLDASSIEQPTSLSSLLKKGSQVAASLTDIPLISQYAGVAAWTLRHAATVASAFGYSKPLINDKPLIVSTQFARNINNADGVSTSFNLGLLPDTQVSITDKHSCRGVDEMSFAFLKRQEAYLTKIAWTSPTSGSTAGTTILSLKVTPEILWKGVTTTHGTKTISAAIGPPIYYLSRFFSFWRGGIRFRLYIPKTMFHIGRLQVTWTPYAVAVTTPTLAESQLSLREIIDIRDGNEFILELPYLLPSNYLPLGEGLYSGQLDIKILNDLKAPDTAASTVNILVFASGSDDFEFQGTAGPLTSVATAAVSLEMEDITVGNVGNSSKQVFDLTIADESVGENFTSVKQLLNKVSQLCVSTLAASASYQVYPWSMSVPYGDTTGMISPLVAGHMFTEISLMYCFFKGGMDVTFMERNGGTVTNTIMAYNLPIQSYGAAACVTTTSVNPWNTTTGGIAYDYRTPGASPAVASRSTGFTVVKVPYQSPTQFSLVRMQTTNVKPYSRNFYDTPVSNAVIVQYSSSLAVGYIGTNVADDFQLFYFLSCPPVYLSST
jgi:hypothetical protein